MDEILRQVAVAFGGTAAAVGVLSLLARSLLKQFLEKDLDRYRLKLQSLALEHEVRYKRVDEKVADALAETYGLLQAHLENLRSYIHPFEDETELSKLNVKKKEKQKLVEGSERELLNHMVRVRLYLPPDLYHETRDLTEKLKDITRRFTVGRTIENLERFVPQDQKEGEDYLKETYEAMSEVANPLVERLVFRFQQTLGVYPSTEAHLRVDDAAQQGAATDPDKSGRLS